MKKYKMISLILTFSLLLNLIFPVANAITDPENPNEKYIVHGQIYDNAYNEYRNIGWQEGDF